MPKFATSTRRTASVVLRYGLAVLSVAAALFIKELLTTYFDPTPNSLFFCAVVLSSWVGGLGPGLLASSLSVVLIDYQFKSPFYTLELNAEDLPRMVVFFLSAASISWLSASQKRARESLRQARDELDTKVQERTAELRRANEELQAEIGERKEAEVALRSSEAQLTQAQRIAHLGSYEIDVLAGTNRWSDEIF
jgi:K+-sensing histidine kinase KdpD